MNNQEMLTKLSKELSLMKARAAKADKAKAKAEAINESHRASAAGHDSRRGSKSRIK